MKSVYNALVPFYNKLPVLVTGGAGFIGSHLVEKLVELGAEVTVLDNLITGNIVNLNQVITQINFIEGSLANKEICLEAAKNKKVIFHLAAATSVPESFLHPHVYHETNIMGTVNLLESARTQKVKTVIFSSSSAVYGNNAGICSEETVCIPISPYGYSKLIGELICREYTELFNVNTICLRYLNVFGERQKADGPYAAAIAKFRNAFKNNAPITIFGDGSQTRDFVPVSTIIKANVICAMRAHELKHQIYNIGTGKSISLLELMSQLKQEFSSYNQEITFAPARSGDIPHSRVLCEKYTSFLQDQSNVS